MPKIAIFTILWGAFLRAPMQDPETHNKGFQMHFWQDMTCSMATLNNSVKKISWNFPFFNFFLFSRSFWQVISQSFFGNIWWNFSWNLLIWRIFYSWTKSWLKWPWNSVFLCKNGKMGFFWSELFLNHFSPWSCSLKAIKFYMMVIA